MERVLKTVKQRKALMQMVKEADVIDHYTDVTIKVKNPFPYRERLALSSSADAAGRIMELMGDRVNYQEVFIVAFLNHANKVNLIAKMSEGGMTGTVADVRLIMAIALNTFSNKMIVAHNHPSGNLQPSNADKVLTEKIKQCAALFDIQLLDHLIIANNTYLSFADEGFL